MRKSEKRLVKWLCILVAVILIGYGGYKLYNYLLEKAIDRITKRVRKEVKDSINPLRWPGKILDKCKH